MSGAQQGPRDTVVTGIGLCLPGPNGGVTRTVPEFWETISTGTLCVHNDGVYFGAIPSVAADVAAELPEIPRPYIDNYAPTHLYGLTALFEALADAGIDWRAGAAENAALLTARAGMDTIVAAYRGALDANPDELTAAEAKGLFMRLALSGAVTDVGNVQASLLRSTGPSFCVSCGCASSAVLLGRAMAMIRDGEVDTAIVTGVDAWNLDQARHLDRLRETMKAEVRTTSFTAPELRMDRPMRPYDRDSDGFNMGDGAVTLVVEAREHAQNRGAGVHGWLIGQATRRGAVPSALAATGVDSALSHAARDVMGDHTAPADIAYVNGGAQGDPLFNQLETDAVADIFADTVPPYVTSQEACFGHVASGLGNMGVAATLLMMRHGQIAPTAGCRVPDPALSFDPLPGTSPKPVRFDRALSVNYQVGGVASAILLGAAQ
ncbi:beta-ketoacyl synthase N-terminal-like domain-containing protein [Allosalinactinospora lopnorensis]|uniref:beta-ketoacyl synthase N-terminal-like domain-containing protein n=1 Tax=Allosalinactinospora lopnorensis TaxID=1352348 RepID=UPI000623E8C3|nr:beta-ketoacyl synthase N-terminal-like domain-containing protein [Allosalinactinospora lopnorensis]